MCETIALSVALLMASLFLPAESRAEDAVTKNQDKELTEIWTLAKTFTQPESAAFDSARQQIFVSNVNGYAEDGNGFVSRVSASGELLDLKWLEGINSPTGLTVAGNTLYVVDYNVLLAVNIDSREINKRYSAPDEKPGLNDVVVASNGDVFVTGSAAAAIYVVEPDGLRVWKQDSDLLKNANGLFEREGILYFGGERWLAFDIESREQILQPPNSLKDIDGISDDGCGGFIVTLIDDARLWRIEAEGKVAPLSQQSIDGIDLSFAERKLFVPRVGGHLGVFVLQSTLGNFC